MIKAKGKMVTVRVSKTLYDRATLLSDKLEISRGELIRLALNELLHSLQAKEKEAKARGGK